MLRQEIQSIARKFSPVFLLVAMIGAFSFPVFAQEVPSNLQVVGTITAANSVTPALNDLVLIVQPSSLNRTEGQGTVIASDGTFFVDMAKTQAFNGTQLTALLRKGGATYQLNSSGAPIAFPYSGTFPFPARLQLSLTVGTLISGGGGGGGDDGDGGTVNDSFDVNDDGVFNQADVDAIKSELGSAHPNSRADVDNNGLVNSRDVINAIKALNSASRSNSTSSTTTQ